MPDDDDDDDNESTADLGHSEESVAGLVHLISNQVAAVRSEQCRVGLDHTADLLTICLFHESAVLPM